MENAYWVGRTKASLKSAQEATSAEARLIHYELAGRQLQLKGDGL